jgi:hypothetical protein
MEILGKINLLSSPEGSLSLLVHLPNLSWSVSMGRVWGDHFTRQNASHTSWYLMGKRTKRWGFS